MKHIDRYLKLHMSCLVSALIFLTSLGYSQKKQLVKTEQPNVILILADDMAFGDLSFVNDGQTRTPNLDQLVLEGVWFSQAYSASPVCAPARAALLTGLYPHQTNCVTLGMRRFPELTRMDKDLLTLADAFNNNGYATGMIGKWHVGEGDGYHPLDRGFQEFEGFVGYMVNTYFSYELDINRSVQKFDDLYLTHNLSERAIEFVRRHKDEPFFLHLAHYAPHRPLGAPQEFVDYYLKKGYDENNATIYAMIEVMDRGIGQLIAELDALGIREKTLVIFTSDNGPDPIPGKRQNQGLRGTKYMVYEGGIHVPFIVNWKGGLKPDQKSEVIHFTDVFPTLADIADLKLPEDQDFDGGSITGILMGSPTNKQPGNRFWQWNRGVPVYSHNAAMRQGKWKLVRPFTTRNVPDRPSAKKPVLYDLENDPYEEKDVSEQNERIYQSMNVMLEEWCREVEFIRLQNKND